jgi:hypothetical protein
VLFLWSWFESPENSWALSVSAAIGGGCIVSG